MAGMQLADKVCRPCMAAQITPFARGIGGRAGDQVAWPYRRFAFVLGSRCVTVEHRSDRL
jgi:hypothetical protein